MEWVCYRKIGSSTNWKPSENLSDGVISAPFPRYDDKLIQFIFTVEKTDLMMLDYLQHLENKGIFADDKDNIKTSDFETLKAILTYYVRQERFGEGLWGKRSRKVSS